MTDLTAENVAVDDKGDVKVIDLGNIIIVDKNPPPQGEFYDDKKNKVKITSSNNTLQHFTALLKNLSLSIKSNFIL